MSEYVQNGDSIFRDSAGGELVYDGVDWVNGGRIIGLLETVDAMESQIANMIPRAEVADALVALRAEIADLIPTGSVIVPQGYIVPEGFILSRIDATIAKLGLPVVKEKK
jgi:hypothetical protein